MFETSVTRARVLIVDDHPGTAEMLARAVSQLGSGLSVLSATSAGDALQKNTDGAVDMLITDMVMPDMNGLELIQKMRAIPDCRLTLAVLITAYETPGLREDARRLQVNEIVIKPFRPERICQIVSNALGEAGPFGLSR